MARKAMLAGGQFNSIATAPAEYGGSSLTVSVAESFFLASPKETIYIDLALMKLMVYRKYTASMW